MWSGSGSFRLGGPGIRDDVDRRRGEVVKDVKVVVRLLVRILVLNKGS